MPNDSNKILVIKTDDFLTAVKKPTHLQTHPNLNTVAIDSFKLRIPILECEILSSKLGAEVETMMYSKETGEIFETTEKTLKNVFIDSKDGIKTSIGIERMHLSPYHPPETFIIIKITAKLLKENYFQGITRANIDTVYSTLMSYKLVSFSKETFLSSVLTDCDFKKDVIMSKQEYRDVKKYLIDCTIPTKKANRGIKEFHGKSNQGIQFATRKYATISNPYMKIYNKEIELRYKANSQLFYHRYLSNIDISDVFRLEITIKSKKHFDSFGIPNNLGSVLLLDQSELKSIMDKIISKHIRKPVSMPKTYSELSPTQIVNLGFMKIAIDNKMAIETIIDIITEPIKNKVGKSRQKKSLLNLVPYLEKSKVEYASKLEKMLESLGFLK